jgi:Tfp pilus assembly protein PilX
MTNTTDATLHRPGERGSALVTVLLLLMLMSALVAALGMNGQTETFISRNEKAAVLGQAAAEAGLNHAVELATTYIFEFNANGFADADAAIAALLGGPDLDPGTVADNTSLAARAGITAAEEIRLNQDVTIAGTNLRYRAWVMDDSPTAGALAEDANLAVDINKRLMVRATGFGPDNSVVTLEAVLAPVELPGVITNGNLTLNGGVKVLGDPSLGGGGVHSNGDLEKTGASGTFTGTLSTSGEYIGTEVLAVEEGVRDKPVPEVRASDYRSRADFILTDTGTITNQAGVLSPATQNCHKACNGWTFSPGTGTWSFGSGGVTSATYYVEGNVTSSGNPTTHITVIAEGDIDLSGGTMTPHTPELLFVTDGDLGIRNLDAAVDITAQGQMLVHGQIDIYGNVDLAGQLVVEDVPNAGNLTDSNDIGGSVTITYNGGLGSHMYGIAGWRDVRDLD